MNSRPGWTCILAAALALAVAGCAELPPLAPARVPPAPTATVVPRPAAGAGATAASRDSAPSPEALGVLATIPEPLPAQGATMPKPATPSHPDTAAARAPSDTGAAADTSSAPVPSPTTPLGAGPPVVAAPPPELPAPAGVPPPARPPAVPARAALPDTCWRVQVGAPVDRVKGKQLRDASESILVVPMVVDREAGLWKVRTRDCLSRGAAESLRERAVASGFRGVFLVRFVGPR